MLRLNLKILRIVKSSNKRMKPQPYRVVVCDQDPVVAGVLAHVLGVDLNASIIARSLPVQIRVEILGQFDFCSAMLAVVEGEKFAAHELMQRRDFTRILSVVTINGLTEEKEDLAFVARAGVPVVNLANLQSGELRWAGSDPKTDPNGTPLGSGLFYISSAREALRVAEICRTFASDFIGLKKYENWIN